MPDLVSTLHHTHPLACAFVAQVRQECADFTWFYDHGYIRYNDGTKVMLREHQRVAVAAYGVNLRDGWNIHHIDANRLNNCADNLAVLSPSEHHRLHGLEYRRRVTLICPNCQKPFEVQPARAKRRTYCSEDCVRFAHRKVERPSRQYLAELIAEVNNWRALGRMFKVTDNTVRGWARDYGLL